MPTASFPRPAETTSGEKAAAARPPRLSHRVRVVLLVGSIALLAGMRYSPWRLSVNLTPSEPRGVYIVHHTGPIPARGLHYGELVQFRYECPATLMTVRTGPAAGATYYACADAPVAPYPDGTLFIKQVMGLPKDVVTETHDIVQLHLANGRLVRAGRVLTDAPDGRPVPYHAVWAKGGTIIPAGHWYAGSVRVPQSYDSRYFGLVSTLQIVGTVRPLWLLH